MAMTRIVFSLVLLGLATAARDSSDDSSALEVDEQTVESEPVHPDGFLEADCPFENTNGEPSVECKCADGFKGTVTWTGPTAWIADTESGTCEKAECTVENSNGVAGNGCECKDGFAGQISWALAIPSGSCTPAKCTIPNSNMESGLACACKGAFTGFIEWDKDEAMGICVAAKCLVPNSNGVPGIGAKCADGFKGTITWEGDTCSGQCDLAPCTVENSNRSAGSDCSCPSGFDGEITWKGHESIGECKPAACDIANSNQEAGLMCACQDGYTDMGHQITWLGNKVSGTCEPAACKIPNSNEHPGHGCSCLSGFEGTITWNGEEATGKCKPVKCDLLHSNKMPGIDCKCVDGFQGIITWDGTEPAVYLDDNRQDGGCLPAPCNTAKTDGALGLLAECANGFQGAVSWSDDQCDDSDCKEVPCTVLNSNQEPGPDCKCSEDDGYFGTITWQRTVPFGTCKEPAVDISALMLEQDAWFATTNMQFGCCVEDAANDDHDHTVIKDFTVNSQGDNEGDQCQNIGEHWHSFDRNGGICKETLTNLAKVVGRSRTELVHMVRAARKLKDHTTYTQEFKYTLNHLVYTKFVNVPDWRGAIEKIIADAAKIEPQYVKIRLLPIGGYVYGWQASDVDMMVTVYQKLSKSDNEPDTKLSGMTQGQFLLDVGTNLYHLAVANNAYDDTTSDLSHGIIAMTVKDVDAGSQTVVKSATESIHVPSRCCCTHGSCEVLQRDETKYNWKYSLGFKLASYWADPVCPAHFGFKHYTEVYPSDKTPPEHCQKAGLDFVWRYAQEEMQQTGTNLKPKVLWKDAQGKGLHCTAEGLAAMIDVPGCS